MRTRRLGSQGPELTVCGFGAWAIGGAFEFGWGPTDDDESVAAIRSAVEGGVNWVDTAAVYGRGHSEELVRRALEPYRVGEDVLVFTKCGRNFYGEGITYDLRPESIRFECEQSLRRLCVDCIDVYQIHWPDIATGTPIEESWGTMSELVDEGKARSIGVSNFSVELLERCEAVRHVDSLQPPLSILVRGARGDVIPWCREHGTGVVVYSPMANGLLTGAFSPERLASLDPTDWRRRGPLFQEPLFSKNLELVERLKPIAEWLDVPLASLAVAWALAVPGVTGAIVGAKRPSQVEGWLPAGSMADLDPDTLEEIEELVRETEAGLLHLTPPAA